MEKLHDGLRKKEASGDAVPQRVLQAKEIKEEGKEKEEEQLSIIRIL